MTATLGWIVGLGLLVQCGKTNHGPDSAGSGATLGTDSRAVAGPIGGSAGPATTGGSGGEGVATGGDTSGTQPGATIGTVTTTGPDAGGTFNNEGGFAGASGAAGAPDGPGGLECLQSGDPTGALASCEPTGPGAGCCSRCAAEKCCDEYSRCLASDPPNVCGAIELNVLRSCMFDGSVENGYPLLDDLPGCIDEAAQQSLVWCGLDTISGLGLDLAECLRGDEQGEGGCFEECFNPYFDEAECSY